MKNTKRTILDRKGQGLTEYLTLLLLISISAVAVAKTLGNTIRKKIEDARTHINSDITIEQ